MSDVLGGVPDWIRRLAPYAPGLPTEELERHYGITGSIKLASNENPLGPSPRALAALAGALTSLHRYPDGSAFHLTRRLADRHGVAPEAIVIGNGSNEILELTVRSFMQPGDEAVMAAGAFLVYSLVVQAAGGVARALPLRDFTHDLPAMAAAVTDRTRLVFVANPNNPTGTIVHRDAWREFLGALAGRPLLVVADEAYAEYVADPDYPDTIAERTDAAPPLLSLRTFSKVYGLAGLRIGYGVGDPAVVDVLRRVRQPFNVNALAQVAALAALDDEAHVQRTLATNREGLAFLGEALHALGVPYVRSAANFLLVETGDGPACYEALLRQGVITRPMGAYGFPDHLRVTVGLPAENERFVAALRTLRGGGAR